MAKYRIIGNMTGNSMDAIDLVLTEFDGDKMRDICSYSKPYTKEMQDKIESLRKKVFNKTKSEILNIADFKSIHDEYVRGVACCIDEMLEAYNIDKNTVDAIGFHGKTLDHYPPSMARKDGKKPYTLQIGSGKMLADLTGIPVVYDFRSLYVMNGFEGAPLVMPHNAHIAKTLGDGVYYNGGNTSNFAIVVDYKSVLGADSGPCNEYVDAYIRLKTKESFDKDGMFGLKGKLNKELLAKLFDVGRAYYEMSFPKSGDPQYYHKDEIFRYIDKNNIDFSDVIYTLEYFSAYVAVYALTLVDESIYIPSKFVLFGGGWKNPVVKNSLITLLNGKGYVLKEHTKAFKNLYNRFNKKIDIVETSFGDFMEARLFADMARYKLENKCWEIFEVIDAKKDIVAGVVANPEEKRNEYDDMICEASNGWR